MNKSTHEIRLAHWSQIIEQCQGRPKKQTAKQSTHDGFKAARGTGNIP